MKTVEWYQSERGVSEPLEFVRHLPQAGRRKLGQDLLDVQEKDRVATDLAHQIRGDLWVLRSGPYRLLYFVDGGWLIVVTAAFRKQSQKEPPVEAEKALARMAEWRRRRR